MDRLLIDCFLEAHAQPPEAIWLDLDATDDPIHGRQEGRFFHGYYGCYCDVPLYIFCGEHLLCARLRKSDIDASAGSVEELQRILGQIRAQWPATKIVIRGDAGFCREAIMAWCEAHGVDFVLGLANNERLLALSLSARVQSPRSPLNRPTPVPSTRIFTAPAQCGNIRLTLLKIAAQVRISVRRIWLSFSEGYPYAELFRQVLHNLRAPPPVGATA
jgi:hypothetical protein